MLTPSDKELDRLSREAAEQYEPDESISSWEKLEARLDRDLGKTPVPSTRRFGRGPIVYSAIILLITGASYFLLTQNSKIHSVPPISKSKNESITKRSTEADAVQSDNKSQQPDLVNAKMEKNAPATSDPSSSQKTDRAKAEDVRLANPYAKPALQDDNTANKNDNKITSHNKNIVGAGDLKTGTPEPIKSNTSPGTNKPESVNSAAGLGITAVAGATVHGHTKNSRALVQNGGRINAGQYLPTSDAAGSMGTGSVTTTASKLNKSTVQPEKEPGTAILPGIESISNHPPLISGDLRVDPLSGTSLATSLSGPISNKSSVKSRTLHLHRPLTIGILFGPDITTVHGIAPDRMSGNIGLTLSYQLTDRLSVNTGFISTKKFYSAKGSDFHSQMPTPNLDFVRGDCNMYEIPVTIRYDFDAGIKTNFFVNGGLSSYLMTHQSYIYYGHYSGPGGSWSYASQPTPFDSNANYLFSVITLSAGIEHRIGKNLSLQGEPFVKIPLTGMGVGNMNLSSYGVSFSLRYSPTLGKSRH